MQSDREQFKLPRQRAHFRHEFGERIATPTARGALPSTTRARRLVGGLFRCLPVRRRSRLGVRRDALWKQSATRRELGWRRGASAFGLIRWSACSPASPKRTRHERGQFLVNRCGDEFLRLLFSRGCTLGPRWAQHGAKLCLLDMQ